MSTAQADWDDQMRGRNQRGQVMDTKERAWEAVDKWLAAEPHITSLQVPTGERVVLKRYVTAAITEAEDAVRAGIVEWLRDLDNKSITFFADAIEAKEDQS